MLISEEYSGIYVKRTTVLFTFLVEISSALENLT